MINTVSGVIKGLLDLDVNNKEIVVEVNGQTDHEIEEIRVDSNGRVCIKISVSAEEVN